MYNRVNQKNAYKILNVVIFFIKISYFSCNRYTQKNFWTPIWVVITEVCKYFDYLTIINCLSRSCSKAFLTFCVRCKLYIWWDIPTFTIDDLKYTFSKKYKTILTWDLLELSSGFIYLWCICSSHPTIHSPEYIIKISDF